MLEIEKIILDTGIQKIDSIPRTEAHIKSVQGIIYRLLTQRVGFQEKILKNENFLTENLEIFQPYKEFYKQKIEYFSLNFPVSDNPAWLQFNIEKNFSKTDINLKIYKAINPFELQFLEHLDELFFELQKISQKYHTNFSFKIPNSFIGLYGSADNIVIHFSDSRAISDVQKILENWSNKYSINFLKRGFGRTEIAADPIGSSFSDYIANYYALKWLE